MLVRVQVYGGMRDFFAELSDLEVPPGAVVEDVVRELGASDPACKPLLANCVFVVENLFVDLKCILSEGAVLEVMPPFSGG